VGFVPGRVTVVCDLLVGAADQTATSASVSL
jgi:hypothetical protein